MRASSTTGEAWRNVASGTARTLLWVTVFLATVGLAAWLDVRSIVGVIDQADSFQHAGGAVDVLEVQGLVNAQRCDAIAGVPGVAGAGAIRVGNPVTAWNLPSTPLTVVEASPTFISLLARLGTDDTVDTSVADGVWLTSDLASSIGAVPGATVHTSAGTAVVAGVFTWPDDGRSRDVAYAMIAPVPADGPFDQCWVDVWPQDSSVEGLVFMAVEGTVSSQQMQVGQLNSTRGARLDAIALIDGRLTAVAGWVAAVAGVALGFVSGRIRRLELASALHARVPKAHLALQMVLETAVWAASASILGGAALLWAWRIGNVDPSWAPWLTGMRTVAAGACATILGVVVAVGITREKHLFRYSKER